MPPTPTARSWRAILGPSYPNPSRTAATIAFELPHAGDIALRLYDVAGREVAMLANGWREAGRHEVPVATGRLAPGTYSYVLRAGSTVESRKLIVRR
ncbi:MAG: T9SS type A sorting domain-containing protein [Candidatus Eisenbacteria bacterium]|uniref:T9SS type A sorting domain-containing protein n=1 Tax=Eiseniibacteriota bacterium TaxID=2212470 RepID=A0A538T609_UNCEI|nr:MAG: T9SS type A sorting domain-containing protein [Candidatus Eisenbacteria bacterium]